MFNYTPQIYKIIVTWSTEIIRIERMCALISCLNAQIGAIGLHFYLDWLIIPRILSKMIIRILVLFNPQDLEIPPIVCTFAEKINIV